MTSEEGRAVRHPQDFARRISLLGAARPGDAHLLKLERGPRSLLARELVHLSEVTHGALVEGAALIGRHPALPVRAGHVNLLADLLERLLEERERVQRDGLLLLGGLLAASTHHEGVMEARELRRGSSARELRGGVRLTDVSAHSAQSELHS